MLKKIKVCEVINYDTIMDNETKPNIGIAIRNSIGEVLPKYGVTDTDYQSSVLYNLLSRDLDMDYFIESSSQKYLSRFTQLILNKYEDDIIAACRVLADSIADKFGFKWWKISEAITTDYKPLENYNMEEIRTPNLREELTRKQSTDTNVNQKTESGVYGFNSTESNPTATGEGDTHTTGLKANNETEDVKSNTGTESLTRHGNIGVTTSQQMLESEIKLRQFNFIEEVFTDIDSILCLKVY